MKRLEVHHMDGCRENNSLGNLITVCQSCHNFLDKELRAKNFEGRAPKLFVKLRCLFCFKEYSFESHRGVKFCSKSCYKAHTKKVSELTKDFRREKANQKIRNRYKNDIEYKNKRITYQKKYQSEYNKKIKNTPQLLEKYLQKNRENVARHRAKNKVLP